MPSASAPRASLPHPPQSGAPRRSLGRLPALEPYWLLLLAPALLLPGRLLPMRLHAVVVLGALLFWPVRLVAEGRLTLRSPVRLAVGLLLLCLPLPIAVAVDRARAWEVAGYLLLGVAGANALVLWPPVQRRPQWIAWGLLAATAAFSLAGPLLVAETGAAATLFAPLRQATTEPLIAALGEVINPNALAEALLPALPLAAALALTPGWTRRRWARPGMALLVVWLMAVLLMMQSRGAWLAVGVVLPLLAVLRWPRLIGPALLLPAAGVVAAVWAGPALLDALASGGAGAATSGFAERVEIWQRARSILRDAPFTGLGLDAFEYVVPVLYPYILIGPDTLIPHAHNLPLQVGADLGLPGLVAWGAVLLCLLLMAGGALRDRTRPLEWALAAGALGALVATLVAGIFGATNWGIKPAFLFWMVAALVVLLHARRYGPCSPSPAADGVDAGAARG